MHLTALRLPNGMRHPKRIVPDLSASRSSDIDKGIADVHFSTQACVTPAASCPSSGVCFAAPSDLRSARASFRRSSSSLLAEFDSSVLKFSSSLSFKNPSAFSQCWRQARSQMHGWGLFANEFIPPGQRITEYAFSGMLISALLPIYNRLPRHVHFASFLTRRQVHGGAVATLRQRPQRDALPG
jgi:hypothetical protein